VPTVRGLNLFNKSNGQINQLDSSTPRTRTYFAKNHDRNHVLLGTNRGLYKYSINKKASVELKPINDEEQKLDFVGYDTLNKNKTNESIILFGQSGIFNLDQDEKLKHNSRIQQQLPTKDIRSIHVDKNRLFIGTSKYGLYQFNLDYELITRYTNKHGIPIDSTINSIEQDDNGYLWLGSDIGLIRLNITTKQSHTFYESDGLQSNYFQKSSSLKTKSGQLIFGGRNGFNAFYPKKIKINQKPPKIVLTNFLRFGQSVEPAKDYDGFKLNNDINEIDELVLSHKDYVIGFEFAALDYAAVNRNKYAFKMEGLDPNWNYVDAYNRSISYSNLKPGDYVFRVKGANKDGVWNEKGKNLRIKVLPAPWLSWRAWLAYILLSLLALWWYVRSKTRANEKITKLLRVEVEKKTKILQQKTNELQIQKQTVESLLIRKNELFANISHEFRTPLTLIIGPIQQLLKKSIHTSDMTTLRMIDRNANRLLTMIEQLLQLAKISDGEKIVFKCYKTQTHIKTIVDSFKPLASEKKIELKLQHNDAAAIKTTENSIEIILGNLLSNAIKYTPNNGQVTVSSQINQDKIDIKVKDTGPGLDSQQQIEIFNRFKRLNPNQNIAGVGIGLSVVEEVLKVNNASIKIDSIVGKGSTFVVTFNTIGLDFNEKKGDSNQLLMEQLASDVITEKPATDINTFVENKTNETILIIDDIHDMRQHIASTLKESYHCLLAADGKTGIAMAVEHIPDVIICDVMMPEMDGFEVSRVLRSDTRTSHIPLIMLTALNDKASRIRGWREHVDVYLTKPFDANELTIQMENILVIRNILKQKAGNKLSKGNNSSNLDLPELDQKFVEKLNQVIRNNFRDTNYLRPQMASDMAVSIKQLQRKLKALIDKNPMDLLRDYRLNQAADQLKSGYQVGIISDNCGFNSVSYFSQCFKAKYGLSPKKYQQICNKK
jgi:signal transduction histidine kinase/DNA-binding NarL/FixJ family response regulator